MNKSISTRDLVMILFLFILLIGVCYYMFFLTPLKEDIAEINTKASELDSEITVAEAKIMSMDAMQKELDEILSRPANQITEIAPYDNAKVVMNELNAILAQGLEYDLAFDDPRFDDNGLVRRVAHLSFVSGSYENAKTIITDLATNHWRCVISDLSVSGDENIAAGQVNVQAVITFYENTNLS